MNEPPRCLGQAPNIPSLIGETGEGHVTIMNIVRGLCALRVQQTMSSSPSHPHNHHCRFVVLLVCVVYNCVRRRPVIATALMCNMVEGSEESKKVE